MTASLFFLIIYSSNSNATNFQAHYDDDITVSFGKLITNSNPFRYWLCFNVSKSFYQLYLLFPLTSDPTIPPNMICGNKPEVVVLASIWVG